jgi:hypothetical protein
MPLNTTKRRTSGRIPGKSWDPWWHYADDACWRPICQAIEEADNDPAERRRQVLHLKHMAQYDTDRRLRVGNKVVSFNVTQAIIDTAVAQVAGNRTTVMTLTKQGDSELQRKAKRLNQFIDGQFEATGQYQLARDVFQDAAITGTGVERAYVDLDAVCAKVIDPLNLIVPPCEQGRQHVRQVFEAEPMPLYEAQERYPEYADELATCQPVRDYDQRDPIHEGNSAASGPTVYIYHAWLTARCDEPQDEAMLGKHVICIDNCTLKVEEYCYRDIPHSVFRWKRRPKSFWGLGICHVVQSVQEELDEMCWKVQDSMRLAATMVLVKKGTSLNKQTISNRNLSVHEYTTTEPIVKTNAPIDASYFAERDKLYMRGFDLSGVSPLAAHGMKPAGINSGKGLRLYKDIASQRLKTQQDDFDALHVDCAYKQVRLAKAINDEGDGSYRIMASTGNELVDVPWADVDMGRDQFRLQRSPISYLSTTPTGKTEDIQEMAAAFPELRPFLIQAMDFPDLQAFTSKATAPYDEVQRCLDSITEDGEYMGPEPGTDLAIAKALGLATLRRAKANNLEQERLEQLRDYLLAVQRLEQKAMPPAPPPGAPMDPNAAPPALPPGPPMPGPI